MTEIEINLTQLKKIDFDEIISELKEYTDEFEIIYKELILPFVKKGCCTTLGGIYAIINNLNDMNSAYKDIISLYEMIENRITDSANDNFTNKSTDDREIPKGYILVDNMDYIPESQDLYDRLYTTPTEEYDESGNPINGLSNLHNSDTAPDDFQ